jgi:putative CocE/NonD family hydrolase
MNTTAPDTDLFVMLTDVDEYGFSRPVSLGVMRVRFRDSFQSPTPVTSAEINEYIIDLTPCANRFLKGHALRLDVMGSYFPFLTRNLNTGTAIGQDKDIREASLFVLHDFEYPARLVLPVLP